MTYLYVISFTKIDMKTISIVIPTLNEAEAIEEIIAHIPERELTGDGYKVEILIVDGG